MATQKSCSGTQSINSWALVNPGCTYQVTLLIDGNAISNTVALNPGMSDNQIETIFNANRTGNTTGTISVSTVGNNLEITINSIILSSGSTGEFQVTASGTGAPCPDFNFQQVFLTCALIPSVSHNPNTAGAFKAPSSFCSKKQKDIFGKTKPCPQYLPLYGYVYEKYYEDQIKCCYRQKMS